MFELSTFSIVMDKIPSVGTFEINLQTILQGKHRIAWWLSQLNLRKLIIVLKYQIN